MMQDLDVTFQDEHLVKSKKTRYDQRNVQSYDEMNLKEELLRGIYAYGMEKPSPIQQRVILPIVTSEPPIDVVVQAQSGTGKTLAFVISMLERLEISQFAQLQGLILCPTRELALNIHHVIVSVGEYMNVRAHACVGGFAMQHDIDKLKEGMHIDRNARTCTNIASKWSLGFFQHQDAGCG